MFKTKINLQLFAAGDVVNGTTSESLSAEMKTFYDKTLIELASPYLVHDQFGQKRDIPENGGKIIEFSVDKMEEMCVVFQTVLKLIHSYISNNKY